MLNNSFKNIPDRDHAVLRNSYANENNLTNRHKIIDFWRGHDTTNTTDNKWTETQLLFLQIFTSKNAKIFFSLTILNINTDSQR